MEEEEEVKMSWHCCWRGQVAADCTCSLWCWLSGGVESVSEEVEEVEMTVANASSVLGGTCTGVEAGLVVEVWEEEREKGGGKEEGGGGGRRKKRRGEEEEKEGGGRRGGGGGRGKGRTKRRRRRKKDKRLTGNNNMYTLDQTVDLEC